MARPKLETEQKRQDLHLLLHPATLDELRRYCQSTGLSMTGVIEDAIIIYLAKRSRRQASAVYGSDKEDRYAD